MRAHPEVGSAESANVGNTGLSRLIVSSRIGDGGARKEARAVASSEPQET